MFGPDTTLLSDRHVIFVDLGNPEATRLAKGLFASTMAQLVDMSLEEHDRVVAMILGLSHALNIAFSSVLAASGESLEKLHGISSSTFDEQLAVATRVADDNPHLYFEIQSLNRYGDQPLAALEEAVARLRSIVMQGDEEAFVRLMTKGREVLSNR
jgi:chorismate mutase/prephenate dehydrogenase